MRDGVIISDLDNPSIVYGVHGTEGDSRWKCLARRSGLHGAWEAVEWAWLPPGGISGEHMHTRTEEVYFILSGQGEMLVNGNRHLVESGDLILTGLGAQHGLRNIGRDGLGWLVIELLSPATDDVLNRNAFNHHTIQTKSMHSTSAELQHRESLMNVEIVNLRQTQEVDPGTIFSGPLRKIELVHLLPGESTELTTKGVEYALFVLSGTGQAASSDESNVELNYGTAITLPLATNLTITAGQDGLEYFLATLEVSTGKAA